ncbi:hypothetical protein RIF29_39968 [Crotalaria pallida]|uniref:Uncharacterized protein n=1 Tax=Crotalaria pallida TaxID=3830 RepID=A0AAN9HTV3_CROPI
MTKMVEGKRGKERGERKDEGGGDNGDLHGAMTVVGLVLRLPTCSPLLHPLPLLLSSSSPSSLVLRPLLLFYAAADLVAISIVLSLLSYASSTTKKTRSSDLFLSHPCPSSSPTTIFCRSFPHDRNDHHRNPEPVSPPPLLRPLRHFRSPPGYTATTIGFAAIRSARSQKRITGRRFMRLHPPRQPPPPLFSFPTLQLHPG